MATRQSLIKSHKVLKLAVIMTVEAKWVRMVGRYWERGRGGGVWGEGVSGHGLVVQVETSSRIPNGEH